MLIRKMRIGDYEEMHVLWKQSPGIRLSDVDDSRIAIDSFLARNPDSCFIAEQNNKIVATILAGNDGRRGHIYHMVVDEKFRNQGIATKLLDLTLQALKNRGIAKVSLVVFKENSDANIFWKKRGFMAREDLIYRDKTLITKILKSRNDAPN